MALLKIHTVSSILAYIWLFYLTYCMDFACLCADRWNDWHYQWIAYDNWNYSRVFNITSNQIEGKTVWLKCDGLDTVATVRCICVYHMSSSLVGTKYSVENGHQVHTVHTAY